MNNYKIFIYSFIFAINLQRVADCEVEKNGTKHLSFFKQISKITWLIIVLNVIKAVFELCLAICSFFIQTEQKLMEKIATLYWRMSVFLAFHIKLRNFEHTSLKN